MGRDDWYRNEKWTPEIEAAFFVKLGRARDKQQYLRIQAGHLVKSHPYVALELLEQVFTFPYRLSDATAYCAKAEAHITLRDITAAIEAYEAALVCEANHPFSRTNACLDLPILIVRHSLTARYPQVLQILEDHSQDVLFPFQAFHWNCALAIVSEHLGEHEEATNAANRALDAASKKHSGFSRHPKVGLVNSEDSDLIHRLEKIIQKKKPFWSRFKNSRQD